MCSGDSLALDYIRHVLHLIKLSVGPRDLAELRAIQAARLAAGTRLRHRTRMFPRRAEELLAGGSIYWVIAGAVRARQRLIGIEEETGEDGRSYAGLMLDPVLVPVRPRVHKPFQGWRYLPVDDAPADMGEGLEASGVDDLPAALRKELEALALI